jgi:hypothetical protein
LLPLPGVMTGLAAAWAAAELGAAELWSGWAGWPPLTLHAVSSSAATAPSIASPRPRRWTDSPIPRTMGLA